MIRWFHDFAGENKMADIVIDSDLFLVSSVKNLRIPNPNQQMARAVVKITQTILATNNIYSFRLSGLKKFGYAQSVKINNPLPAGLSFFSGSGYEYVRPYSTRVFNLSSNSDEVFTLYLDLIFGTWHANEGVIIEFRNYPDFPYDVETSAVAIGRLLPGGLPTVNAMQGQNFGAISSAITTYYDGTTMPGCPPPTIKNWGVYIPFSSTVEGAFISVKLLSTLYSDTVNSTTVKWKIEQAVRVVAWRFVPSFVDALGTTIPDTWFSDPIVNAPPVPFSLFYNKVQGGFNPNVLETYSLSAAIDSNNWSVLTVEDCILSVNMDASFGVGVVP